MSSATSLDIEVVFFCVFQHHLPILISCYPLANEVAKGYSNTTVRPFFRNILVNPLRINILQWILTKLGTHLVLKRIWNPIDFQGQRSRSPGQIFTAEHPCQHSRINILQCILTKLGTCLVLKRFWNAIDFQGHRSEVKVTWSNI